MTALRSFRWVAIAVALGLFPSWSEAQCVLGQRDVLGELCPGRVWNPFALQLFQHVTYNPVQDHYLINTSTWDGANGISIATTLDPEDGTVDPVTIDISGPGVNGVTAVATSYNSVEDGYLAAWRLAQAPQTIQIRYLGADATPISPVFAIGAGDPPGIAYSPDTNLYLVTWSRLLAGTYYTYYALIDGDPTSVSPIVQVGLIDSNALSAVVAYNPTSQLFVIAYVKDFAPNPRRADIYARTVSAAGVLGAVFPIDTSGKDQQRPVIAASTTGFAILYEDWDTGQAFPHAVGVLLDQNGGVVALISAGTSPTWEVPGAITYNQATNSYMVAWRSAGNVGVPEHFVREFDAVSGLPVAAPVLLTTIDSMILSAASRPKASAPQSVILWAKGVGDDGVHAGIHLLPPQTTALLQVDAPVPGPVTQPFSLSGWAVDPAAPAGTGVDLVEVWLFPQVGSPTFLGAATYGISRPDVATFFGDPRFDPSGYQMTISGIADGNYMLGIFARSTVSNEFDAEAFVDITVSAPLLSGEKTVAGDFKVGGAVTYSIVLTNSGSVAQADNAGDELSDTLDSRVTITGANASSGTAAFVGDTVTWNGSLAPAAAVTITVTATIDAGAEGAVISNQGMINFDIDGDGTNDTIVPTDDPTAPGTDDATIFQVSSGPVGFFTLDPCRVIDTRNPAGPLGGPVLSSGDDRSFIVAGACGIPVTATSISVNIAVTGATSSGFLSLHPDGTNIPQTSSVNYKAGQTRSNNAVLSLGENGGIAAYVGGLPGTVHFILDVNGYFE